ncbi:hypothetical protein AVEN_120271-1 [Araneus ventricosus]|uniref:Uncharacterized protein n=1 Tax=Araneus ventricosus TaxID=182803 RepID=A0A4Y2U2Q8_ARAVE|nr:hypothetical protein AVEN_120271-1 [Araneus ventricosus]
MHTDGNCIIYDADGAIGENESNSLLTNTKHPEFSKLQRLLTSISHRDNPDSTIVDLVNIGNVFKEVHLDYNNKEVLLANRSCTDPAYPEGCNDEIAGEHLHKHSSGLSLSNCEASRRFCDDLGDDLVVFRKPYHRPRRTSNWE